MTAPTDLPIDDRLRAHFADRARDDGDPAARGRRSAGPGARGHAAPPWSGATSSPLAAARWARPLLAAAAVLAVVALVAGVALARRDDAGDVSTDPTPPPTTAPTTTEVAAHRRRDDPDTTTSTSEPAPPPRAAPTGPIVGPDGILGSWDGSSWVQWTVGALAPSPREYQVVGLAGPPTIVTGNPVVTGCGATDRPTVDVGFDAVGDRSTAGVAVAGAGSPPAAPGRGPRPGGRGLPGRPRPTSPPPSGSRSPEPRVTQAVRADLDGDGTAEVLVIADQLSDPSSPFAQPGDWSLAFVRQVVGGTVRTSVVDSHVATDVDARYLERLRVDSAVADLNGDGRLEVVLNLSYHEGSVTTVYEIGADGTLATVLMAGCGV